MCQGMYEITEHQKQYINQDDALVTVSFQLPRHDWELLGTSTEWRQFEKLLREVEKECYFKVNAKNMREEVLRILIDFLRMATGDRAADEEVKLFPDVAKLLLDYLRYSEASTLSVK